MDRLLRSKFAARNFNGAVRDDLVDIHVGLRSAAGLPYTERELIVEFSGNDFVRRLCDQICFVSWQFPKVLIYERAGFFENPEGANQFRRHGVAPYVEVQQGSLRLGSPVDIRGDLDLAHAVGFNASLGGWFGDGRHEGS